MMRGLTLHRRRVAHGSVSISMRPSLTPPAMAQNGKVVIDPSLFDLNRVDIRCAVHKVRSTVPAPCGGTVKLVTNQPDLQHFSVDAQGAFLGHTDAAAASTHSENAMINLPLAQGISRAAHRRH